MLLLIFKAKVLTQMVPPEEQFYWEWAASGDVGQVSQGWECGQGCRGLFPIDQLLLWAFAVLPLPPPSSISKLLFPSSPLSHFPLYF